MKDDNLIAREKEEKISFWMSTGIIIFCYNLIDNNYFSFDWRLYLIPMCSSVLAIVFDWISNFIYYFKVEKNSSCAITNTKWFNILRIISLFISFVSIVILYILTLTSKI
jgi:DMSO/TMAO reductase YedYZ heme-binding membrane subunit